MVFQPVKYSTPGEVLSAGIALPLVSIAVVATRFAARYRQHTWPGIDDWLILGALACLIAMGIELIYGKGLHPPHFGLRLIATGTAARVLGYKTPNFHYTSQQDELNTVVPEIELAGKIEYSFQLWMITCYGLTKTSILLFCRRIFAVQRRIVFDCITYTLIGVIAVWTLGFLFSFAFDCGLHFSANWGPAGDIIKYCHGGQAGEKAIALSDLILDILVIAVPIPLVWQLHMSVSRKIAVSSIFLVGLVAIGASIARVVIYYLEFSEGSNPDRDRDQVITVILYWSMLEAGLAVIAACLPSVRFLFGDKTVKNWLESVRSAVSLQSLSSYGSARARKQSTFSETVDLENGPSTSYIRAPGDFESRVGVQAAPSEHVAPLSDPGKIYVERQVVQEHSRAERGDS